MDVIRAKEILRILADGVNPMTGEVLAAEDSCNQPDVIRALHCILAAADTREKQSPENYGAKWTEEELKALLAEFDGKTPVSKIAKLHGRSRGAIEYKLAALGKTESAYFPKRG